MPKHEPLTPKAIANRIKSKGLQKLRWYCQMCQKQCRDQNGFKCHLMSESHQRQLLLFGESPGSYMSEFSVTFEKGFMDIVRRQYGTKRVHANQVYQQYIREKDHIHMNATRWYTLTGFIHYLGKAGICKIDNTEKGWFLQYIDRAEEERQAKCAKKQKMDKDDEERIQEMVQKQAEKAREQLIGSKDEEPSDSATYTELQKQSEDEKIAFSLATKPPSAPESGSEESKLEFVKPAAIFKKATKKEKRPIDKDDKEAASSSKKPKSALDEIREMEESRKEIKNRKDYWLHKGIIVKVVTKKLGDRYYKQKGEVLDVMDRYTGLVQLIGTKEKLKLDQTHVETVIPALGKPVLMVNGAYRGLKAVLMELNEKQFCVTVKIDEGPTKGRVIEGVKYEDVCKLA